MYNQVKTEIYQITFHIHLVLITMLNVVVLQLPNWICAIGNFVVAILQLIFIDHKHVSINYHQLVCISFVTCLCLHLFTLVSIII